MASHYKFAIPFHPCFPYSTVELELLTISRPSENSSCYFGELFTFYHLTLSVPSIKRPSTESQPYTAIMITKSYFEDLPPFPDDIPVAPIARISLTKLLASDPAESVAVLDACRTAGFFYLDLRNDKSGESLLTESESLVRLASTAFKAPLATKEEYAFVKGVSLFGYKGAGTVKQTDPSARPDRTEFFNIAKDHLHDIVPSRTYPPAILAQRDLIASFQLRAHKTSMLVLGTLARELGLPDDELTKRNAFSCPSGDHCRLTRTVPQEMKGDAIGLASHTDFGSVTILFNWLGGLQIQSQDAAKKREWEFVKPLAGHAIVNLGDAMVCFTNGELKSAKHRVVPAPGGQGNVERFSVVYFVKPADEVLMERVGKFKDNGEGVMIGGKVQDRLEGGKVYRADEWMMLRGKQMGG